MLLEDGSWLEVSEFFNAAARFSGDTSLPLMELSGVFRPDALLIHPYLLDRANTQSVNLVLETQLVM